MEVKTTKVETLKVDIAMKRGKGGKAKVNTRLQMPGRGGEAGMRTRKAGKGMGKAGKVILAKVRGGSKQNR